MKWVMDMNLMEGMFMSEFSLWDGRQGRQLREGWESGKVEMLGINAERNQMGNDKR